MSEDRIIANPDVMLGKPVVQGTRITVEHIMEELAAGSTVQDLLEAHPRLSRDDVHAALAFALEAVRLERVARLPNAS